MVEAVLQLAKATRRVGFDVMQFTIDLKGRIGNATEYQGAKHGVRLQDVRQSEFEGGKARTFAHMWETCVAAHPMLKTAAKKL